MAFGLGRGLEALIPTTKSGSAPVRTNYLGTKESEGLLHIGIERITPNPHQPRTRFHPIKIAELADSIKKHGILEPLVVSPADAPGMYVLVAGERRLRAAEMAGLRTVPAVVRATNSQDKLELALVENLQRQDLNPLEEARALRKLLDQFGLTIEQVAKRLGRATSTVSNSIRLLGLAPEAQKALLEERITEGHARAILATNNQAKQVEMLKMVEEYRLSVRQTERLGAQTKKSQQPRQTQDEPEVDPVVEQDARELSRHLGTKVQIVRAPRGGRIVVEYYSEAERQRVVRQILRTSSPPAAPSQKSDSEFTV